MYNTKFECRYHKDDVFLETDNVTEEEKEFIRNILYREDVLNIFLIDFNDDFMSSLKKVRDTELDNDLLIEEKYVH